MTTYKLMLEVTFNNGTQALRSLTLPFVPFLKLMFNLGPVTFVIQDIEYGLENNYFTAHSFYPNVEPEELKSVLSVYKKAGFDIIEPTKKK